MNRLVAPILAALVAGCVPNLALVPQVDHLAPWTDALSKKQPEDAYVAVYKVGGRHLVFVGAVHENQIDSPTFKMIGEAFSLYRFDQVIIEGYPTAKGPNPARLLAEGQELAKTGGFQPGGETVPSVRGAVRQGAQVWGGEPEDADVLTYATERGLTRADVLGFYVLRVIPQWLRERQISQPTDPRLTDLIEKELARQRPLLGITSGEIPDAEAWHDWYRRVQGHRFNDQFSTEEAGPRVDGVFPTNRIGAIVAEARDAHLHRLVIGKLNGGGSVLIVFGGSHLMVHRPALQNAIGRPCYLGASLAQSIKACR